MTIDNLLNKIHEYNPKANFGLIKRAYNFAAKAHQGQKRMSGRDYIKHPLYTAYYLAEMKLSSTTIVAGLLHDVIDDTDISYEDIKKEFGDEVAFLVDGVSKLGKIKYRGIQRHVENLRKMFLAMAKDIRVILIKLCDRLHNLETLSYLPKEKQKRIALESLEIYARLSYRLGMRKLTGRIEDAAFPYAYPQEYQELLKRVKEKYEERKKYLEKIKPIIKKKLKKEGIRPIELHLRSKRYYSLYKKLQRYDMNLNKIYDLVALRIIVKDIKDCYRTLGVVHKFYKPLLGRIKDYISLPKPNGYRSLHTTVFCIDGKITEFQIRTPKMHKEAEYGIAAHWYYSEQKGLRTYIKKLITKPPEQEISWVKQLQEWQKESMTTPPDKYLESLKIDFLNDRIFVFTPQGDVIDLPEGACSIDFAYTIHTEIGNQCAGAKVNGKIVPLSRPLKNGDLIEIITEKNKKPSKDWLKIVKTNIARSRIKAWLKKEALPQSLGQGNKLLNQEFKRAKGISWSSFPQSKKEGLLEVFPYKNLESLIVAVGEGRIKPKEILKSLFKEEVSASISLKQPTPAPKGQDQKVKAKILIAGKTGYLVNLAKCCSPQPGDEIRAYITKDRGASIHKIDCGNLKRAQKKWPQKIMKASWKKE